MSYDGPRSATIPKVRLSPETEKYIKETVANLFKDSEDFEKIGFANIKPIFKKKEWELKLESLKKNLKLNS